MNRNIWITVGAVTLVFLLTNLLPWGGAGLQSEETSRLWKDDAVGATLWDRVAPYLGADLGALGWTLLFTVAALLLTAVVWALLHTSDPRRRRARHMVRRGRSVMEVARRMGLSQDAVRTLLEPAPVPVNRSGGFGRIFRAARFSPTFRRTKETNAPD